MDTNPTAGNLGILANLCLYTERYTVRSLQGAINYRPEKTILKDISQHMLASTGRAQVVDTQ